MPAPADSETPAPDPSFTPTSRLNLSPKVADLVSRAAPLYYAELCTIPYYAALKDDSAFWTTYVLSRIVSAQERVAAEDARLPSQSAIGANKSVL